MIRYLLGLSIFLLPVYASAEYIDTFKADIEVRKDASFTVTETIDYRFSEERHGIFREIPLAHPEKASAFYKERIIDIELTDVKLNGGEVPYVLESTKDQFVVRIGDPDTTLTGAQIYEITYTVEGGLSYPPGEGTELYWNVTGNEWDVPIRVAEVRLHSPDQIFRGVRSCYRGTFGFTSGSCLTLLNEDGSVTFRTTELEVGEGITVAQSLNPTVVAKVIREETNFLWFLIPLFGIVLMYGSYRVYRYQTANTIGKPIVAQYEPYPGTKPMYAGILMDGELDPHDITACIVYLAERGYLKIRKTEKKVLFLFEVDDYEITILKEPDGELGNFERKVLELIFTPPLTQGQSVTLSSLKGSQSEQKKNYEEYQELRSELRKDLQKAGFYEHLPIQKLLIILGSILVIAFLVGAFIPQFLFVVLFNAIVVCILVGLFISRRRTRKGYEALNHLEGFKLFLEMTDRDRFAFHNAPQKSPEQFMAYLPYAIAFGVEKEWAKTFESITLPPPSWYDGGSAAHFTPVSLTQSIGAFSDSFASSSGVSTGSASSGGGSVGGGSGGGGGGSW